MHHTEIHDAPDLFYIQIYIEKKNAIKLQHRIFLVYSDAEYHRIELICTHSFSSDIILLKFCPLAIGFLPMH